MAFIPKYEYAYATWRYHVLNLPEEFVQLIGSECYTQNAQLICESRYQIEEKNPQEMGIARDYLIENSIASTIPVANSPDDFSKVTNGAGDYYYSSAEGGGVAVFDSDLYVNIEVPSATYTLRDGYYRFRIVIENKSENPDSYILIQHFSGCDNYTLPIMAKPGKNYTYELPFNYDSSLGCPEDNIVLKIKGVGVQAGEKVIVKEIEFYEVTEA